MPTGQNWRMICVITPPHKCECPLAEILWKSKRGVVSDDIADILDEALEEISKCLYGEEKKKFTIIDLADAIEFVTRGILSVELNEKAIELQNINVDQLFDKDIVQITFENRGQIQRDHYPNSVITGHSRTEKLKVQRERS